MFLYVSQQMTNVSMLDWGTKVNPHAKAKILYQMIIDHSNAVRPKLREQHVYQKCLLKNYHTKKTQMKRVNLNSPAAPAAISTPRRPQHHRMHPNQNQIQINDQMLVQAHHHQHQIRNQQKK